MKKLQFLLCVTAGCLAFTSCDEDNDSGENLDADLTGTYELTRLAVPNAQDFDNDGDTNTNLVMEGSCYNESWISFHEDGTYEESYSSSVVADGGTSLECDMQTSSGTYVQDGNTVTTTRTSGEGSLTATFTFDADSHTLTQTDNDGEYAGWNSATNLFANLTGNLQLEFTKYTENEDDNGQNQDDDNNADASAVAEIVGNFDLSSFIVGTAQNLDNDTDSSTNLLTESSCYSASNITFDSDGTYEETVSHSILGNLGTSLDCSSHLETGTWTRIGDMVITRHLEGDVTVNTEYTLNTSTNVLTRSEEDGEYPAFNTVSSLFAMLTGTVDLAYTRD